ncbi:MAG: hypothetical protein WCP55_13110, partial [Lentisphaerota bacterium]
MMKISICLLGMVAVFLSGNHVLCDDLLKGEGKHVEKTSAKVEDFGVRGFRKDFFGTLTVIPYSQDKTIEEGHSKITYAGKDFAFDKKWMDENVEFLAYRIHKNPANVTSEAFFPAITGSRYSKVIKVIDEKNLIVDFEYNGGNPSAPQISEKVSGYFFIDCAPALRKMVQSQTRPENLVFESGKCYVCKGMPNIPFLAKEQSGNMRWISSFPGKRASIKISAEDAVGEPSGKDLAIPCGPFFKLDTHDFSIYLQDINIIGPTYTVPVVQDELAWVMFDYGAGQCERTLEIRNCNTFAEKDEYERIGIKLPPGANWLAPSITGIVGGGGKIGDRGDGVLDIIGYQRFNLIRSTWISKCVHSIKNNDGAGNWVTIDGVDTDRNGMPVNMVYEALFAKRNRFDNKKIAFHDFPGVGAGRGVRIESDDFSWKMMVNQYWIGGTSTIYADTNIIEIDGFKLYFGNNGDWRRELQQADASCGYINATDALLFDRIPRKGDKIKIGKNDDGEFSVWGWGVQEGDILDVGGKSCEVASRKRKYTNTSLLGIANPRKDDKGSFAHYWSIKFKDSVPKTDAIAEVKKSGTEYLLDGKPRTANLVYDRDFSGHLIYNRAEVNYEMRNICFSGNFRQTSGPAKGGEKYHGLWEFPVKQEWVNCWAMDTDGSSRGTAANEIRSEAFNKEVLQLRNNHPDN